MPATLCLKPVIAAAFALMLFACSNSKKDKVKVTEITMQDIKQEDKSVEPPPPPPPQKDMTKIPVEKKCFSNDGLKYKTIVTIYLGDTSVVLGNVMAEELESGKKQTTEFTGTISGEGIIVNFKGEPPVIGTASEWTNNIWTIKKTGRKEILYIIFSAKDYDTNKWKDTDYQFELIDCK